MRLKNGKIIIIIIIIIITTTTTIIIISDSFILFYGVRYRNYLFKVLNKMYEIAYYQMKMKLIRERVCLDKVVKIK